MNYKILICFFFLSFVNQTNGQNSSILTPPDTLNKTRFNIALAFTATAYTTFSIGFYNTWYKKYEKESFHLFNDWGEWERMDKAGHVYSGYFQAALCYKGAKWTGLSEKKSILTGIVLSSLFQSTLEVMDGFSSKWGFSIPDLASNVLGVGLFASQQSYWKEQRITLKESSFPRSYSTNPIMAQNGMATTSLEARASELYGSGFLERYLKDYNVQVYWASVNVHSFLHEGNKWPKWLNVAVGYGAENMFGGFDNSWESKGNTFVLNNNDFPRYHQFYIGLDIDLPKLNPKNPILKTLCSALNIFKVPAPALEINTQGQLVFHLLR